MTRPERPSLIFSIRPFRPSDGVALEMLHRRAIMALAGHNYTREECASWAHGYQLAEQATWKTRGGLEIATARVVKRLSDEQS